MLVSTYAVPGLPLSTRDVPPLVADVVTVIQAGLPVTDTSGAGLPVTVMVWVVVVDGGKA
ncbi:hypothetical protein GCM10025869_27440 [Homoserinibacter gongjuensis]|uniref:Uncharacterized protein n=1 Tax=Homoserinibacter gongjuensis TaxID=1162968 RepID=A0ABQ6JZJ4_9MICO|nr:hypothetical protein GCM10025869_27440 [Homoserinibacter gongjuensis]